MGPSPSDGIGRTYSRPGNPQSKLPDATQPRAAFTAARGYKWVRLQGLWPPLGDGGGGQLFHQAQVLHRRLDRVADRGPFRDAFPEPDQLADEGFLVAGAVFGLLPAIAVGARDGQPRRKVVE